MAVTPVSCPANLLCKVMEYATLHWQGFLSGFHFKRLTLADSVVDQQASRQMEVTMDQGRAGKFQVVQKDKVLLTGTLLPITDFPNWVSSHHLLQLINNRDGVFMDPHSIYQFFQENGCTLGQTFSNICEVLISENGFVGKVKWDGCCELYIDSILNIYVLYTSMTEDTLTEISSIAEFIYDPSRMPQQDKDDVLVYYDAVLGQLWAEGVRMSMLKTKVAQDLEGQVEMQAFQAFSAINSQSEFLGACLQIVHEAADDHIINIVYTDNSKVLDCLLESRYFTTLMKSQVNFKLIQCKDGSDPSVFEPGFYLFLTDVRLTESLARTLDSSKNRLYLIESAPVSDTECSPKFTALSPVLERIYNNNKIVFYKKTMEALLEANLIQVPEGYLLEKTSTQEELIESERANFFLFKYKEISDIRTLLEANKTYLHMQCTRFVFSEDPRSFDPTNDLFLSQLNKDFKINVCHKGVWGYLRKT